MTTTPQDGPEPAPRPFPRLGVFGLMLGIFLSALDGQILSAALPTVVGDLGGVDQLSWLVTAYLLTASVTTPLWGKLGDLYGRKGAFLASVVLFLAGSALSGMASDMEQLIAFRAVQGLGGGGLMVGALSVIGVLVAPEDRGRSQSMIGVMMPVAFVGGPLLGGFLTDHVGWRWAFYVNLPVGAVVLLVTVAGVRLPAERIKARVDVAGITLLTLTILALTLLGSWGGTRYAWLSPQTAALGAVAAAALAGFVRAERRAAEPIIPPRLFHSRTFVSAQILSFLGGAAMLAVISCLPQYLQLARGASSTSGGTLLLPLMLGMLAAQLTVGRLEGRLRHYHPVPVVGGVLMLAGALLLFVLDAGTSKPVASALTAVLGLGLGTVMQSATLATLRSAPPRDMGAAAGTVTLLRTIGGTLGASVLGAVYTSRMGDELAARLGRPAADRLTDGGGLSPAALAELPARVRGAVGEAVTQGLYGVLVGAVVLSGVVLVVAVGATRRSTRGEDAPAPPSHRFSRGLGPRTPKRAARAVLKRRTG
ncbi:MULTISPECIES: MDR family MFS transporter [Streptomyces]|uniref:MDR family MFS transporter n=1 Tax=Streptomyces TaxID=1883 RepID=UPI00163BB6F3|nr:MULTISPECIES: MDR family MFS transporter [Streptomyces]MBC2875017.1 MFS transporter [Streptomyces sp. TYQ1024]UBI37451.1 MFS transporter [Streptomyces mobaraensis]UKW30042.1 MFS transporter [Streptomyces sp. TYQ1024]